MIQTDSHDPTRSATTYPTQPKGPVQLSRNEIETLCLKAARGAGMAWGLAEEAGFAAGWLAAQGIDGAAALCAHLQTFAPGVIAVQGRHWQATGRAPLCPIALGAALDDHALLDASPATAPVTFGPVSHPVLLVAHLARLARASATSLMLTWPDGKVTIPVSGAVETAALTALSRVEVVPLGLAVAATTTPSPAFAPATAILPLGAATLAALNLLALQTTVPASDTSRRGAGAAASDND